jgi:hypothetical protein
MDPRDIAKQLTDLDFNDGTVMEDVSDRILTGWGPFTIYFKRGTVMKADYVAPSRSSDPNLYFVGINSMETSLIGKNRKALPRAFILADRSSAEDLFGIRMHRDEYLTPFKRVLSFNANNVMKMERTSPGT